MAGIHGVGKTFLAVPAAQQLGIQHATASQLIREERGMQSWRQDKQVIEVDSNQAALVSAVERIRADGQSLLLDGHFVLRGDKGAHIPIAESVFRDLRIDAVLLLENDIEVVFTQLTGRGDHSWSVAELTSFASDEAIHAANIASVLDLPFHVLRRTNLDGFKNAVETLLGS